jgi:hypothetical protein
MYAYCISVVRLRGLFSKGAFFGNILRFCYELSWPRGGQPNEPKKIHTPIGNSRNDSRSGRRTFNELNSFRVVIRPKRFEGK